MSKPWGGIGAWADEAERADEEAAIATKTDPQSFPSLKEATSSKPKKKKMTLSEFTMSSCSGGLRSDEMIQLPTGPRQRSPEEMQYGRLAGGYSSSFNRSGPPVRDREDSGRSWGGGGGRRSYGGFEDEGRGPRPTSSRVSDFAQPSRADVVENWGKAKKAVSSYDQGRQSSRYGGLGGGSGGGFSKADEIDSWTAGKKPAPVRSSNFGSEFRDSGSEPYRWTRGGAAAVSEGFREERPRLVLHPPKSGDTGVSELPQVVKTNKPNPFGTARPREEVLANKCLDWKKLDSEIEAKKATSRTPSAQSSRPSSAQSNRSDGGLGPVENVVAKPRPKVNPFGDAKPREVLLKERGQDWRKLDLELEHRRVDRPELEEEKMLKEEIGRLKKELEKETTASASKEASVNQPSLQNTILQKEQNLEILIRELDDKVGFRQKAVERPGSAAGRSHSQSGSVEEFRSVESMDRPRSRGSVDSWSRPVDDRRNFHGSKQRGFFSNRNLDRSAYRGRW